MTSEMINQVRKQATMIQEEVKARAGVQIDIDPLEMAIRKNDDKMIEQELMNLTLLKTKYFQ